MYIKLNQYCHDKGAWITRARDIYAWISLRNLQTFSCHFENSRCTIIPSATGNEQFFTLHLPSGAAGTILSKNAEIIRKQGRYLYIKTHNLHEKIVVDFA
jgi:hypothetical protein